MLTLATTRRFIWLVQLSQGPIVSNNGMTNSGSGSVVNITAETTLTFASHAGRIIEINDADGALLRYPR